MGVMGRRFEDVLSVISLGFPAKEFWQIVGAKSQDFQPVKLVCIKLASRLRENFSGVASS